MGGQTGSATPPEERKRVRAAINSGPFGRKNTPVTRFPNPPQESYGFKNSKRFFEYWRSIPENLQEFVEVRVYRTWPQVKMELVEPDRKDHCWEMIHGACPFDPENFETQVMQRDGYGSGDYRFDLKEAGTQGVLTKAYIRSQDLQMFPPVIDYSTLVNCPANQEYIRGLMKRNIKLPWEYAPEEENEMAQSSGVGEAMQTMANAMTDIAKTAVNTAREVAEVKVEAAEARVEAAEARLEEDDEDEAEAGRVSETALSATIGVMTHGFNKTIDMITAHAGQQYDPIQMMKALKEYQGGDATLQLLIGTVKDMAAENQKLVREFTHPQSVVAPVSVVADPMKAAFDRYMARKLEELFEPPEREEREPAAVVAAGPPAKSFGQTITENIVPIVGGLTTILALGANIVYNMQRNNTPRDPAEDMAAAARMNPLAQMPGAIPGAAPMPGVPAPAPPPQQQPPVDLMQQARPYIDAIAGALKQHFFDPESDGCSFAEYVRSNRTGAGDHPVGMQTYTTIVQGLGREKFEQLIRENHDIWSAIGGLPPQVKTFLDEFFSYEQWSREQDAAQAAGVSSAA